MLTLRIGGQDYEGWHAVTVRRDLERAVSDFACSVAERAGGRAER
jgi:prophage tail gpP-like protein